MFKKLNRITLLIVFMLVLIGGAVRSTGSGMGCPDWPKCFGRWVPPTSESQLPSNYHEIYADSGYKTANFDAVKTWIEYFNRLFGVLTGAFIIATWGAALPGWKAKKQRLVWSTLSVLLVGFQGWLGAVVVKTELHPWVISAHMAMALLLMATLILSDHADRCENETKELGWSWKWRLGLIVSWALTWVQFFLGVQVRQHVDVAMASGLCRCCWLEGAHQHVLLHRGMAILLIGIHILMIFHALRTGTKPRWALLWGTSLLAEWMIGLVLVHFEMPVWAQPLHLGLATLIFCIQWDFVLETRPKRAPSNPIPT
jgi:cytochrome c oxidase assembly protein subunit 15